jgi:hypothetical protein
MISTRSYYQTILTPSKVRPGLATHVRSSEVLLRVEAARLETGEE